MKDSFILYLENKEQIDFLTNEQKGVLLDAIFAYAETGETPKLDKTVALVFSVIRSRLDRDAEKYEERRRKNAENGSRGGRPKNQTVSEETEKTERFFEKPKKADNDPDPDNDNDPDNDPDNDAQGESKKKRGAKFAPPSVEQVAEYVKERGNKVDPEAFVDFYASKGWKVGDQPMKDWRAAVRTWERREPTGRSSRASPTVHFSTERTNVDYKAIERELIRKSRGTPA